MVELPSSRALDAVKLKLLQVLLLFVIDQGLASVEVGLVGLDASALGDNHVAKEEDEVHGNTNISSDKVDLLELDAILCDKGGEVLGEADENAEEESDHGANLADGGDVGHSAVVKALSLACLQEEQVGDEDGDPGHQTKDGGEVDEVAEDLLGIVGYVHESQTSEQSREHQGRVWDTTAVGSSEDGRRRLVGGEAVEGTAGNVEIRVGGGEDENENTGVDETGEGLDTGERGSDDKGTGGSGGSVGGGALVGKSELLGIIGNNHSDQEDTEAVENENTVECQLDGLGDRATRVLGFTGSDTNELSSQVGESGIDHNRPESHELASCTGYAKGCVEGSWVVPVAEAWSVAIGAAATGNDQTEEDNANDDDDLE